MSALDRLLVMGGTGMLGHVCVAAAGPRFDVHASVRDPQAAAALGAELHAFDVWDGDIEQLVGRLRPAVVFNCIGLVKQLPEATRSRATVRLNALFPHELAEACDRAGARLIHVSSDCVFSGNLALGRRYREDDPADPEDLYGRSKLLGEVAAPALTLRTSIIGPELRRASGLLEWLRGQAGRDVRGFTRALFSGMTTSALAEIMVALAERHPELAGLYHLAAEPISKYDLLVALNERLELGCRVTAVDEPVVNRALDPSRFTEATGLAPPAWDEMLDAYRLGAASVTVA